MKALFGSKDRLKCSFEIQLTGAQYVTSTKVRVVAMHIEACACGFSCSLPLLSM
jgi:hypothetical protein